MARYYFRHQKLYDKPKYGHISQPGDVEVFTDIMESDRSLSNSVHVMDMDRLWVELEPKSYPDYISMFLLLMGD